MPSSSVSFQLERQHILLNAKSHQQKMVGSFYMKQKTTLEVERDSQLPGAVVTANGSGVSLGDDETLHTHHQAAPPVNM